MIYLASPYSHPDAAVRHARYEAACDHAVHMLRAGRLVYSPVAHSYPLAERGLPGDWAFWAEHSRAMLARCTGITVLTLPGWEDSVGVQAELAVAANLRIPIVYEAAREPEAGRV